MPVWGDLVITFSGGRLKKVVPNRPEPAFETNSLNTNAGPGRFGTTFFEAFGFKEADQ